MDKKQYNELLLDCYKENCNNIEKWVFEGSIGALAITVGLSGNIQPQYFWIFCIAIILFVITVVLQLVSAHISKEGCDYELDDKGKFQKEARECFSYSEMINKIFSCTFVLAVIFLAVAVVFNNYETKDNIDSNSVDHIYIKANEINHTSIERYKYEEKNHY